MECFFSSLKTERMSRRTYRTRDEAKADVFATIEEARDRATKWLWIYNNERPNMANGGLTPAQKLKSAA
jgi:transposase InsO family protein